MIHHGLHIVDGGLLLPPWACWVLEQHLSVNHLRELAYVKDIQLFEILTDLRTVGLQGRADLIGETDFNPGTIVAKSRNLSDHSLMNADEAAGRLQITARAVRKAAMAGRLAGTKSGARGDWIFTLAAVRAFAESRSR